jgi:hypothetical protein
MKDQAERAADAKRLKELEESSLGEFSEGRAGTLAIDRRTQRRRAGKLAVQRPLSATQIAHQYDRKMSEKAAKEARRVAKKAREDKEDQEEAAAKEVKKARKKAARERRRATDYIDNYTEGKEVMKGGIGRLGRGPDDNIGPSEAVEFNRRHVQEEFESFTPDMSVLAVARDVAAQRGGGGAGAGAGEGGVEGEGEAGGSQGGTGEAVETKHDLGEAFNALITADQCGPAGNAEQLVSVFFGAGKVDTAGEAGEAGGAGGVSGVGDGNDDDYFEDPTADANMWDVVAMHSTLDTEDAEHAVQTVEEEGGEEGSAAGPKRAVKYKYPT